MRGMDSIVAVRRAGLKPDQVTLGLPGVGLSSGEVMAGQVLLDPQDRPESADLRAFVGLRVVVMAPAGNFSPAEAWASAVCGAGAKDVGIALYGPDSGLDGPVWIRTDGEQLA